jgi:hypothetical protein
MPLSAGTKLGSYGVLSQIGAGGMGEVYQAHDSNLRRDVAIKVLPESFAHDADRLSRFRREAQLLASLNHPNIATIHGLEESNGTSYLVMELVPGETLAQRIKRDGAVPVEESLTLAKQIAEALEAAHEKGIIHRDLKPANVKLTPEGKVKVLDFGLAKAFAGDGATEDPTNSPTLSMAATMQGVILGTAAYMSPEQARGKAVDKRTDIWAFGCVLYELLTGKQTFSGEDVTEILAAVVKSEPDWTALPAPLPGKGRDLLRHCLQKDRGLRLRDAGDAQIEIQEAIAAPKDSGATQAAPASTSKLPWAVAAGLATIAVVAVLALWRTTRPVERSLVRLDVDLGADVSLPPDYAENPLAISPDGTRLAYLSGTPVRLFIRRLDQAKATELPGTQGAVAPFFSPDGLWVGFISGGKLNKVSVEGGAVVPLADVATFGGASWGEDGNILVSDSLGGLERVPAGGGPPQMVAEVAKGEYSIFSPQILPGGKAVLFTNTTMPNATPSIQAMTLADHHRKVVVLGGTSPRYLATQNGAGYLLYTNRATLFAVPFDPDKLETRGTAVPMLDDVASDVAGIPQLDLSRTGTLVYRRGGGDAGLLTVTWIEGAGKTESLLAKPGRYSRPELSPDGQRLALDVWEGSASDIWVYDFKRDTMTRLSFTGTAYSPIWSPDGRYIIAWGTTASGMFAARSDGAGTAQPLTRSKDQESPWSFTPDGRRMAFSDRSSKSGYDLWTVPIESDGAGLRAGTPEVFLQTPANERSPALSPNGRWLAYSSDESGPYQIYVRAFPDKGGKWQISNSGGIYPMWSRNGHELFFETADSRIMVAQYTAKGDSFAADKPLMWSDRKLAGVTAGATVGSRNVTLAPDGKRFAALMPAAAPGAEQAQNQVVFLLNFADELRRKVPVGK